MLEDQAKKDRHIIDEVGPIEFVAELFAVYGARRAGELLGQSVLWGAIGLRTKPEIIRHLLYKQGMASRTAYRLLEDFSDFLHHLEVKHGWHGSLADVVKELRAPVV